MELTKEQKLASSTYQGLMCVRASAGSGKTKTFCNRIANMISNHNVDPSHTLAITFTNKASDEMRKRLEGLIGKTKAKNVTICTFHALAWRWLSASDGEFNKLTLAPDWWIMQKLNDLCGVKSDKNHLGLSLGIRAGELATFISFQKANLVTPTDTFVMSKPVEFVSGVPEKLLRKAYATFETLREESRQFTFDDVLVRFYNKLKNDSQFRSEIQDKYKYILIDEFQDTSTLMLGIVKIINENNLFVVGDWRQSIFSFINANVENILNFGDSFPGSTILDLDKNFRSTQNIVDFSNTIIDNSLVEKYKHMKPSQTSNEIGDKVVLTAYGTEREQAEDIADKIIELEGKGMELSDIAILVRTNVQMVTFQEVFEEMDIEYDTSKNISFFDRKEILDILSYARIVADSDDDASLRRIYNTPNRFLSKQFMEELERHAGSKDVNLVTALRTTTQAKDWKFQKGINSLLRVIEDLRNQTNLNAGQFLDNVVRGTAYKSHISENANSAMVLNESLYAIDKLCSMARKFSNISDFLHYVSALSDKKKKKKSLDAVNIVTIHSSKGLEWDTVFVVNATQESLPHKMNPDEEEERRLFYVACSRPEKHLYVSWYLLDENGPMEESVFVREIIGQTPRHANVYHYGKQA